MRAPFSASRRRNACSRGAAAACRRASPDRAGRASSPSSTPSSDRRVGDRSRHRPRRVLIGGDRDDAVAADASDRRLDADEHRSAGRVEDRARRLGADVGGPEARRGADARARAAGRQHRPAVGVAGRGSRRGSYGLKPKPRERVVVGRHVAATQLASSVSTVLAMMTAPASRSRVRQRGLVGRHQPGERQRAAGRRHVGGVDVVLERDRDAVQRPAHASARGARGRAPSASLERPRVDGDDGVEPALRSARCGRATAATISRDVVRPLSIAARMSAMLASTTEKGARRGLRRRAGCAAVTRRAPATTISRARIARRLMSERYHEASELATTHRARHRRLVRHRRGVRRGVRRQRLRPGHHRAPRGPAAGGGRRAARSATAWRVHVIVGGPLRCRERAARLCDELAARGPDDRRARQQRRLRRARHSTAPSPWELHEDYPAGDGGGRVRADLPAAARDARARLRPHRQRGVAGRPGAGAGRPHAVRRVEGVPHQVLGGAVTRRSARTACT